MEEVYWGLLSRQQPSGSQAREATRDTGGTDGQCGHTERPPGCRLPSGSGHNTGRGFHPPSTKGSSWRWTKLCAVNSPHSYDQAARGQEKGDRREASALELLLPRRKRSKDVPAAGAPSAGGRGVSIPGGAQARRGEGGGGSDSKAFSFSARTRWDPSQPALGCQRQLCSSPSPHGFSRRGPSPPPSCWRTPIPAQPGYCEV